MASISEYTTIRINDELLRRIESLERKVNDLQTRNEKLERMMRDSFIGFKFNKQTENTLTNTVQQRSADRLLELIRNHR